MLPTTTRFKMHYSICSQLNLKAVPITPVGDTLNGHVDDVERDLCQPIVTLSLGCDAVYLHGGPTRDTAPLALMLHSGDVCVLTAHARLCYHGARVFKWSSGFGAYLLMLCLKACGCQYRVAF